MEQHIARRCQRISESPTLAITVKAAELRAQGIDIIGFGAGEPDFDTPQYIVDAAVEALHQGKTRYTASSGLPELRRAICDKLSRDNGIEYTPDQVVVSNGAKHSLSNIFEAILDPGDEVLIPAPCWVSYPEMVRLADGVPVLVHTGEEQRFKPTVEQLRARTTDKTVALILVTPSNPTGQVYTRGELMAIADFAVEKGIYVISDEIYEKLIYDGAEHISIASLNDAIYRRTFTVNGMSKAFAMTGWRIGYAAGPREAMRAIGNMQSHMASNANSIAQYASVAALQNGEAEMEFMRRDLDRRRKEIMRLIHEIDGLSALMPQGAFYVMINISKLFGYTADGESIDDSTSFTRLLLEKARVAAVPGIAFENENYVRLSYATSMENIQEGLKRIAAFVASLKAPAIQRAM